MAQDIYCRKVCHPITLAMLVVTLLHLIFEVQYSWQLMTGLLTLIAIAFSLWYFGIWGGSDSKWLILSMPWLSLPAWSDWCLVFSVILTAYLIIIRFKPTKSLALLVPMNSASIILILFYR
ncbi:MAG: hypothetical protein V7765_04225 [Oleispira sp.]